MSRPVGRSAAAPCRGGWAPTCRPRPSATSWPIWRTRGCWRRRTPRPAGFRPRRGCGCFVNGLLEIGSLSTEERASIDSQCAATGRSVAQALEEATSALSGLSRCAGLVIAPKFDRSLKHIEFVPLAPGRALVVMVTEDGMVENRVIDVPMGMPPANLVTAGNYLNARLAGRKLEEVRGLIEHEVDAHRAEIDELTSRVVEAGLAVWAGSEKSGRDGQLIVRGQANLLGDVTAIEDLERIRALFQALEAREAMAKLLDAANLADGVQIFIGAESNLFSVAGCSVIIAPYTDRREQIVGAIGVIGPTRINYARIIPLVDYTAKVIGRLIG